MFTRFSRLSQAAKIGGAVLMSALLLWATSGVQVASQQQGGGFVRNQILHHLNNTLAQLTAAGGNMLDIDEAAIGSLVDATLIYIPFTKDSPAWQLLFDLVVHRKQVGPVPIGMLYIDKLLDARDFKLEAGYYYLKITNDLRVVAEDDMGNVTRIGNVSFSKWRGNPPQRTVQSLVIVKQNPILVIIGIGILIGGITVAVTSCDVNINIGSGCAGDQCTTNPPPPPPPPPPSGEGGGGGGG
ncbi:MAG: hypothetical protein QXI60_06340 [Thermofilaceae archaeon]